MVSKVECAIPHAKRWMPFSQVDIGQTQTYTYLAEEGEREAFLVQCGEDNKTTSIAWVTQEEADISPDGKVNLRVEVESFIDLKRNDPPFIAHINLDAVGVMPPVRFWHQEGKEHPGETLLPQVEI